MMTLTSPQRSRRAVWGSRLFVVALIAVSLAFDLSSLVTIPLLFVLVVPFEKMFPRHRGQKVRRPHSGLDLSYALAAPALNAVSVGVAIMVGIASLAWLPGLAIRPLVATLPAVALPFVGIALFDLTIYWVHRWSHEVPTLWKFHAVHHSTEHLDWISGIRNHPFDGAIVAPPFVFLVAAGFDPTFAGALAVVQILTGLFLHANVRWRLRPLHRIVITPEFHHWHHANESEAHNSNYSVFLPLWDIVFGTYYMPRNKRPVRYGVDDDMPMTLAGQIKFPFRGVRSPKQMMRHPWRSTRAGAGVIRHVASGVWHSTTRPRTVRPKSGEPCRWATRPPALGSEHDVEDSQMV